MIELFHKQLDYIYDTEDWHPPLKLALEGLNAEQASWKPDGAACNSIWETVNHLMYYKERLLRQLKGASPIKSITSNDESFIVESPNNEQSWKETVKKFEEIHRGLQEELRKLTDNELDKVMNGRALRDTLSSIILHDSYHTGQIIQIRKLQSSWVANRTFE